MNRDLEHDEDGDTLSPAEARAIAEADHIQLASHEELLADFGLTTEDWERFSTGV